VSDSAFTIVYLVRHGETMWNREKRLQGTLDSPLTVLGQAQGDALGLALREAAISRLYTSDLGRAVATARSVGGAVELPLRIEARLRERHYGIFQGLTWPEIQAQHPVA
jgi:probable phosphoglycerate mutase